MEILIQNKWFRTISIKNCTYYFFDDIIIIKNLDPNEIKIDEKSYKNIFFNYTGNVTIKNLGYVKTKSANPLDFTFDKINGYIEKSNGNKYMMLVSTDESKEKLKKYEELWNKIKKLIWSTTSNSDDDDKKYMKTKSNSGDDLPLNKTLELLNIVIVVRSVFHEGNK